MDNENFSSIYLLKSEFEYLEQAQKMGVILLHPAPEHLLKLNFMVSSNNDNQYHITDDGIRYLEYLKNEKIKMIKEQKQRDMQFWTPLLIANLISLASLAVSVIGLIMR